MPRILDIFKSHSAAYFNRILHIPSNNPVYNIIDKKWFKMWKRLNSTNKPKLTTYDKKSVFFTCFKQAINHKILNISNFNKYAHFYMHYRLYNHYFVLKTPPKCLKFISTNYTDNHKINKKQHDIFVFTDGSIKKQLGGCGIYMEYHPILCIDDEYVQDIKPLYQQSLYMQNSYDINYIELYAVYYALNNVISKNINWLKTYKNLHFIIDNKQVIYWLIGLYCTKDSFILSKIQKIYHIINEINKNYDITASIQWVMSHLYTGNIKADKLAKEAIIYKTIPPDHSIIPPPVSTSIIKNKIKRSLKNIAKNIIIKENNIKTHIISKQLQIWNISSNYDCYIDLSILSGLYYSILTQLRTNHIKLNWCYHVLKHRIFYQKQQNNSLYNNCNCCTTINYGMCYYCPKIKETVKHFLLDCFYYDIQRNILRGAVMYICVTYKTSICINKNETVCF